MLIMWDAGKLASFIQQHCTKKLGVKHIQDDVIHVNFAENGDIESLGTANSNELHGDLFIDCSGFRSLLLGEHYKIPFVDCSDVFFIDKALAVQVPYESEKSPIACHTIATAHNAGWVWDIGLSSRRGVGYVYSSRHTTDEQAEHELQNYVGSIMRDLKVREIPIRSGHLKNSGKIIVSQLDSRLDF